MVTTELKEQTGGQAECARPTAGTEPRSRFWSNFLLGACTVALAGTLWLSVSSPPPALAQVPDSGAQRNEMIKELRAMNRKLTEISGYLHDIRDDARKSASGKEVDAAGPKRP